uniref:Ankyrin repeat and SOCS box containing 6 n=1 Tax=Cyprinus carpio TaxID=7962 RepID=A0A8C2IY64_CYPCA
MPFLHGFRRIVYEYQPLVDAVMGVLGIEGEDQHRSAARDDEDGVSGALVELLDRESQSPVFMEGISYSLFRAADLGVVSAAHVLLRYGADLNFEDPVSYYNPLHIAVLRNKPDMVQMLISHGAEIEKRDRNLRIFFLWLVVNAIVTPMSSLTFLVKEALDSSAEDAKEIGNFCTRVAHLLISHGADPSCCLNATDAEVWEHSLTYISLENYDLLFPLTALLLQHGASFVCSHHSASYWTGQQLIFTRLAEALREALDAAEAADVLAKAEVLLDLARICCPFIPPLFPRSVLDQISTCQPLLELYSRLEEQERQPLPLRCVCRRLIRLCLGPWPFEEKVKALPLPDRLKDSLLPENRAGWDRFKPRPSQR